MSRRGSNEALDADPSRRRCGKPNIRVETESGEVFHADHLICTMPLGEILLLFRTNLHLIDQLSGVLEKNKEMFKPPLPKEKTASMGKMLFGTVNKIFIAYEKPFLHPDISEIIVLWNKVDESTVPMAQRWFKKIYSFCKGEPSPTPCTHQ